MKIVVAVKQVPDTETKIAIAPDGRSVDESNITWIVNPYDEYAVEEALRIREARGQGEVIVATVGPARAATALRTCLAMGADRGVHLNDPAFEGSDSLGIARILAAAIRPLAPDLVLTGQYAVGTDSRQVGMMLAELLGFAHVSVVTQLTVEEGRLKARREIEGARELVESPLPCVVTAQKGLNEPRYASLKGIMAAKKKPVEEMNAAALGLDPSTVGARGARVTVTKLELPPGKLAGKIFKDDMEAAAREVVRLLHEEAKVI
ncbi:MAG TPA: electron transfer flavoprotein subunit beta/FixA family protein [Candidatus Polarisedimenticolia bacterium]|nr:electron transfer flavoprotein subunit beta/FixA family protein [Candidatus Polarisedimenticolia bacterium]